MTSSNNTPTPPNNSDSGSATSTAGNNVERLPQDNQVKKIAYGDSPADWVTDRVIEGVAVVIGGGIAGVVATWDATQEGRDKITKMISEGLDKIGQYSQERVEAVQRFLSEKSLENKEPGRPTAENTGGEFVPPKKGATTDRVEGGPLRGKEGWVDKNGDIWVPTNGQAAHGGEHYDVQDPDGRNHRNVYPGGHVRSSVDSLGTENATYAMVQSVDPKLRELLAENKITSSVGQFDNLVAKVVGDAVNYPLAKVDNLALGTDGKNVIAIQGSGEAMRRSATDIQDGMNTDAHKIYQAMAEKTEQPVVVAAQALAPRSIT
jgi:hypothetical protein